MNEQQLQRSDRIASLIMKTLAVIGLASILALVAWFIVHGLRAAPRAGDDIGAAVTTVTSLFRNDGDAPVGFTLENYTYVSGEEAEIAWQYTGDTKEPQYTFSYECEPGVLLAVRMGSSWVNLACETPLLLRDDSLMVRPTASASRFSDVTLAIGADGASATTVVSVVNSTLENGAPAPTPKPTTPTTPTPTQPSTPVVVNPPVKPVVITTPVVVRNDPADLAVSIEETGVLARVAGRDTFFPLSPIPTDREAAVRFIVSNLGDRTSGSWKFTAYLPTEDDSDYRYTSATQAGLLPGAQVEFTLGFDDLLPSSRGTIRIVLDPVDSADASGNNTDSVVIAIDRE